MKQHRPTTRRHTIKPTQVRRFLAELSPCGDGAAPVQVVGWSRQGKWTRMVASYPNGWQLSVNFDRQERVSSWKAQLSLRGMITKPAKAGNAIADSDGDDGA